MNLLILDGGPRDFCIYPKFRCLVDIYPKSSETTLKTRRGFDAETYRISRAPRDSPYIGPKNQCEVNFFRDGSKLTMVVA